MKKYFIMISGEIDLDEHQPLDVVMDGAIEALSNLGFESVYMEAAAEVEDSND